MKRRMPMNIRPGLKVRIYDWEYRASLEEDFRADFAIPKAQGAQKVQST